MSDPEDMEAKVAQSDLAQSLGTTDNTGDIGIQFAMTGESGSSKVSCSDDNLKHEASSMSGQRRRGGRRKQFLQRLGLAGTRSRKYVCYILVCMRASQNFRSCLPHSVLSSEWAGATLVGFSEG